jgi:hypothetical protein
MPRMAKRSRGVRPAVEVGEVPVVGPREPCPCGSGKRYKVCHGKQAARAARAAPVERPFEGLAGETDWIALREFVPAATAPLTLAPDVEEQHGERSVSVVTVLPGAVPALSRASRPGGTAEGGSAKDGEVLVALQAATSSGDPSRDVAAALLAALEQEPGRAVTLGLPTPGPRLQDVLDPHAPLVVTLHSSFDFWAGDEVDDPQVKALLDQATASIIPTTRLASVPAAYLADMGERRYLRWVQPHPEDALLDGLARLHAAGRDDLGPGTRLLGTFRAHGLLVPVWEVQPDVPLDDLEDPAAAMAATLAAQVADASPLDADARRARSGLANRQITLR